VGLSPEKYNGVIFQDEGKVVAHALYQELPNEIYCGSFLSCATVGGEGVGRQVIGF